MESYDTLPQNIVLGSETASTVSSRGVYKFPVQKGASVMSVSYTHLDVYKRQRMRLAVVSLLFLKNW